MPRTVYALVVGIDRYPPPVTPLSGSVNDARAMAEYLQTRVGAGGEVLKLKQLINGRAKRDAVIRAFRTHLGKAGAGDVAFFCYSGHGSYAPAPESDWHLEPDRQNETLLLYDSRTTAWDLADKELAVLISEVAAHGAHVAVMLDCCHSGSGTRAPLADGPAVRGVAPDPRPRPADSYLTMPAALSAAGATRGMAPGASGWNMAGRHVLMAACRADEIAREHCGRGPIRGAFSYFLGDTLRTAGGALSYRDLFTLAAIRVRVAGMQSPQLEATVADDLRQPFLGGAILPAPRFFLVNFTSEGWRMDAGRVHGIPQPGPGGPVVMALFDRACGDDDLARPERAIAKAEATRVLSATTELKIIEGAPNTRGGLLKAVPLRLPTPRLGVRLEGDADGVHAARGLIAASLFVREAEEGEGAGYRLLASGGRYAIAWPGDARPLVEAVDGYTPASARAAVERLEHIERWNATAELDNPATSIRPDEVQVEVLVHGEPVDAPEIRLHYLERAPGEWEAPTITLRVRNTGSRVLYVGLVDLPETFGIFSLLAAVGCERLEPGHEASAFNRAPIPVSVPDHLWERGVGELRDVVKVIVSTSELDARRLEQPDLDTPGGDVSARRGMPAAPEPRGTLERLMDRVQTRSRGESGERRIDDWRTLQLGFSVVRPLRAAVLSPGQGATLTHGVRVEPHPALGAAAVRLSTLSQASRAVGDSAPLPRLLHDDSGVVRPFDLGSAGAIGGVLNVLEMGGVNDPGLVTARAPLTVIVPRPLPPGEVLLAVGFDGEFYLPLGRAQAGEGETRIILERLPGRGVDEQRAPGGVLRILLHRVSVRGLGADPVLAAVGDDGEYDAEPAAVRARVKRARRSVLFVPGLGGDTREMAAGLRRAGIAEGYDAVLAFDFDCMHGSLAEAARALGRCLDDAGLGAGHRKALDVVAHSTGGLVARAFIEREGGSRAVHRLVMAGTPNGGLAWPDVRGRAAAALAVGLNELSPVAWPSAAMAGLVAAAQARDGLHDAAPDSAFLRGLDVGADPGVPYVVIVGSASAGWPRGGERERGVRRLLDRLGSDDEGAGAAERFFGGAEDDLMVTGESMRHLPGRARDVRVADCDHLGYFSSPQGLGALAAALKIG